jgi:HAD superfamily hydrolase (TIGR01509 family)
MTTLNNLEAFIFDMDGLLFSTEEISLSTFVSACRQCSFEPDLNVYYRCIGTNSVKTKQIFIEGYGPNFPYQKIYNIWIEKYNLEALSKPLPLKPGALSLLHYLEKRSLKKAVVTSSRHQNAVTKLTNAEILPFFEFVLGGDEVLNGKPDPEIYLTACRRLGMQPGQCMVFEDSDNGVLSAHKAGLKVIQVPDLLAPSPEIRSIGHSILSSLVEVESLIKQREI